MKVRENTSIGYMEINLSYGKGADLCMLCGEPIKPQVYMGFGNVIHFHCYRMVGYPMRQMIYRIRDLCMRRGWVKIRFNMPIQQMAKNWGIFLDLLPFMTVHEILMRIDEYQTNWLLERRYISLLEKTTEAYPFFGGPGESICE